MPGARLLSRVLVVDDERLVANTLALILKQKGFDARAVYSGEDAAELAITWKPDAVIADIIMGKMDGVALAIYLAQVLPQCKVLLITGQLSPGPLLAKSNALGHDFPLLIKPFAPEALFDFLGRLEIADTTEPPPQP